MKRLFVMILAAGIGIACAHAQRRAVAEQKIGTTVFVEDSAKLCLENKENKISKRKSYLSTATVTLTYDWNLVFEKVFSKERAEQLADVRLQITCFIDSTGSVREVRFLIPKGYDKLKLSEFQAMENQFKACKFKLSNFVNSEPDGSEGYIMYSIPCYFKRMYKKRIIFPPGGMS